MSHATIGQLQQLKTTKLHEAIFQEYHFKICLIRKLFFSFSIPFINLVAYKHKSNLFSSLEISHLFCLLSPTSSRTRLSAALAGRLLPGRFSVGVVAGVPPKLLLLDEGLGALGVVMQNLRPLLEGALLTLKSLMNRMQSLPNTVCGCKGIDIQVHFQDGNE